MKNKLVRQLTSTIVSVLLTGLVASGPITAHAQRGVGTSGVPARPIKTQQDVEALQPGDLAAMACPQCKTITFNYVEEGRGANKPTKVGTKHTCPGCKTTIETVGVGKTAKDEIKHVCSKCGSDMAYCTSVKKSDLNKAVQEPAGAEK